MAREFLTGLNLNKNELLNARVQNLAVAPPNPVKGQVYFDTVYEALRAYDGSVWKTVVHSGDIVDSDISSTAAISISKLELDPTDRANHWNTQLSTTISDFDERVQSNTLDSLSEPTANVSMNNTRLINLASPIDPLDAANKQYVDAARSGLDVKQSVRAATTGQNISLSGLQTIDEVELVAGDRILVKDQLNSIENGVYVVAEGAWQRSSDMDEPYEVTPGVFFFVEEGTENSDSGFVITSDNELVVGEDPILFTQFSGTGMITTGDGLIKDGNIIHVVGTEGRITANEDSIDISQDYVGQTSITTLGTVTTGEWQATTLDVLYGGTGATNATDARANLGATTKYSANNPLLEVSSSQVTWNVSHNFGTSDVIVQVKDLLTNAYVEVDVSTPNDNTVVLSWISQVNVAENSYRVVVIG